MASREIHRSYRCPAAAAGKGDTGRGPSVDFYSMRGNGSMQDYIYIYIYLFIHSFNIGSQVRNNKPKLILLHDM